MRVAGPSVNTSMSKLELGKETPRSTVLMCISVNYCKTTSM